MISTSVRSVAPLLLRPERLTYQTVDTTQELCITDCMSIITEFDSRPTDQRAADALPTEPEFEKLFKALELDLNVAENLFARSAKRLVRLVVGEPAHLGPPEDESEVWVAKSSIYINVREEESVSKEQHLERVKQWAQRLDDLCRDVGRSILFLSGREKDPESTLTVFLIEALGVSITKVAPRTFQFSLKQKWALGLK